MNPFVYFYVGVICGVSINFVVQAIKIWRARRIGREPRPVLEAAIQDMLREVKLQMESKPKKVATLTVEIQRRGPIPDVPQIGWSNLSLPAWLRNQGFNPEKPILAERNLKTGDIIFSQEGMD